MRYLKSFNQLFESKFTDAERQSIRQHVLEHLESLVSFPGILGLSATTWYHIISDVNWEVHDDYYRGDKLESPLSKSAYGEFIKSYQPSAAQMAYDDFVAAILGYIEAPKDLLQHKDAPVSWWMQRFEQPHEVAAFMKAAYNNSVPEIEIPWEKI